MEKPSSFLDKQTLFALIIIFLAWLGWERYMRTKYPSHKQRESVVQTAVKDKKEVELQKESIQQKEPEEKFYSFENERWKLILSSKGAGVKEVYLKEFFDKDEKNVTFLSEPSFPFFQLSVENTPLFFKFQPFDKNKIQGYADYKNQKIFIEILVHKYSLSYKVQLDSKKLSSLQIRTIIHPKEKEMGFISSLLQGGRKGLSFFAQNFKKSHTILYSDEGEETLNMDQVVVLGMGKRYFGQAFSNHSEIIPSLSLSTGPKKWESSVQYQFSPNIPLSLIQYRTFFGPKLRHELKDVHPELSKWIDFGFLRSLSNAILWFLRLSFSMTQNWGLSVILLTLIIRLLLFPLNHFTYKAMKIMKNIQPEMKAIREKYKTDMKKMNIEILDLMKKHNAKPFSMYLPMILQLPIFFALYRVLGESFELYQAPFAGWIQDLSSKDPFYVLPILMGTAMYIQQKISPTNMEPAQEKVLRILPIIFTLLMLNLPSGLTLYILVSTVFGLVQQYYFTKKI